MKRRIAIALCLVCGVLIMLFTWMDASSFRPLVELTHSDVEWIDSARLAERLERDEVLLMDVREPAEYALSHIPGALPAGAPLPPGRDVVVYCSLGVRSADYAERLQGEGFDVLNLDGGIFAWANEGHPLENEDGPTERVHPYNGFFGLFLD